MENEDREWAVLEENTPLPAELKRELPTAPEHGHPSEKVKCKQGYHPIEYFLLFWPYSLNGTLAESSNLYAAGRGAGGKHYPNLETFTAESIDELFGLLEYNGLHPAPRMGLHFQDPDKNFVYGSHHLRKMWPRGEQRWKEFRAFFHIEPPEEKVLGKRATPDDVVAYRNKPLRWFELLLCRMLPRISQSWQLS